ncbi:MAG: HNH endonuclease signature motif containing protein [Dehalococcoidia bacterium]|jgi:hypothetical protein
MKRTIYRNPPLCACGCGLPVKQKWGSHDWNNFINHHAAKCNPAFQAGEGHTKARYWKGKTFSIDHSQKLSNSHKGSHRSEETRRRMREARRKQPPPSEKTRHKISKTLTGRPSSLSKEGRRRKREKMKGNKFALGYHHTEKTKQIISAAHAGENSYLWKGGISKEPYGLKWTNQLKKEIKTRDGYVCQNPNCTQQVKLLDVHHIDYNKKNMDPNNLITLCRSCHSKTSHKNRDKWTRIFNEIRCNHT